MPGMDRVLWSVTKGIFLLVVAFLLAAAKYRETGGQSDGRDPAGSGGKKPETQPEAE